MPKISVVICCANAADTLPAACDSVSWADELVIVDSGSTDDTAQIAQQRADVYRLEPWRGYAGQKIFALTLTSHDWVFILDGDEEMSSVLADQIRALRDTQLNRLDVITVRRENWILGRPVRAWFPDWQARLIHRKRAVWEEDVLHDTCHPSKPDRLLRLRGHLQHKRVSDSGFEDYFSGARLDERLLMVARQMHAKGKRCTFFDLWLRPAIVVFKLLILKRGILDGTFGLMIAQKTAVTTQLKYAALWAVQNGFDTEDSEKPDDDS